MEFLDHLKSRESLMIFNVSAQEGFRDDVSRSDDRPIPQIKAVFPI